MPTQARTEQQLRSTAAPNMPLTASSILALSRLPAAAFYLSVQHSAAHLAKLRNKNAIPPLLWLARFAVGVCAGLGAGAIHQVKALSALQALHFTLQRFFRALAAVPRACKQWLMCVCVLGVGGLCKQLQPPPGW